MYNGSKVALLGIYQNTTTVDWDKIIFKALTLKGIYGAKCGNLVSDKQMLYRLRFISGDYHRFQKSMIFKKGFDVMEKGRCGKVIVNW